jgi:CRISPR-associated protein Csd1
MILQALYSYYQRLADMEGADVAPEGFAPQTVSFALQLNERGELLDIIDLREPAAKGKKLIGCRMIVPSLGKSRSVNIEPNFLWDGPGYVLGRDDKGKPERAAKCQAAFRQLHENLLGAMDTPEAKALLRFLRALPLEDRRIEEKWPDLASANLVFRVGQMFLHNVPALRAAWDNHRRQGVSGTPAEDEKKTAAGQSICLVSGERADIAELHPPIKGVAGAPPTGAALCSYNLQAFQSFGKEQNLNGPVSASAAFAYTTALNYLLNRPAQRLRFGAATVVCWAENDSPLEDGLFALFNGAEPSSGAAPDTLSAQERADILRRLGQGMPVPEAWPKIDPAVRLYVLALKPSTARLSVGFFLYGSAADFLERINKYYTGLSISRRFADEPEFPSVWQVARAVLGPHKETGDIQRLGQDMIQAALSGQGYPMYILPMCLQRLRSGDELTSVRAGLIKAMLIRNYSHEEDLMSLNPGHPSPAYQLGRLFALLAGVQRKAIGQNINAGVRDKYYGAASATPAVVFPLLLRNAQNHISKANAYGYDKLIRDVLEHIDNEFPPHLDLQAQGLFALGYYHQRAEKSVKADEETAPEAVANAEQQ